MVLNKRRRLCFGVLLVLCTIYLSFSNAFSVFAETKDYQNFALRFRYYNGSEYISQSLSYNQPRFNIKYVDRTAAAIGSVTVPSGSNFMSVTAKYNLVAFTDSGNRSDLPYNNSSDPFLYEASINNQSYDFENSSVIVHQTDWVCDPFDSGITTWCRTFTYESSFVIRNIPSSVTKISWGVEYPGRLQSDYSLGANYFFEGTPDNRAVVSFSYDYESALLEQQNQLIMIGNQSLNNIDKNMINIYNQQEQHNQQENQAYDNISEQSASDIQGATNQQTTNLIGFIGSFVTSLGNIQPSNCELTLPFPDFAGGSKTVNICDGKQYAPTLVSVAGSLLLILTFVPLAFIVLRMIYNEIRSWTSG